jgi:energy-coupling factor transport system permease protein
VSNFATGFHPVTRIVWLLGALLLLIVFNDPLYLFIIFLSVSVTAIFICGAGSKLVKASPLLTVFMVASLIIWPPFVRSGADIFRLGPYTITEIGALYAFAMGLRISGTVVVALAFASSMLPEEFSYGLRYLRIPAVVSFTLSLAFRLLPVMAETTSRVVEAQKARGVSFDGGPVRRLKLYLPLIVPVILLNLRRTDQMAVALELRGFAPFRKPVPHNPPKWYFKDALALGLLVMAVAVAIITRLAGYGAIVPDRI